MNQNKTSYKAVGIGVLTAISASLCCITPVLAIISGTSGVASSFSWLEPFRSYLIGISVLVLGFAWYQKLKIIAKEDIQCECEQNEKTSFWHSKMFLGIITLFSILMLSFPYYSVFFYPKTAHRAIVQDPSNIYKMELIIEGMTCSSCEKHVNQEIEKLNGLVSSKVSYESRNAIVEFDKTKLNGSDIENAISSTGYSVVRKSKIH